MQQSAQPAILFPNASAAVGMHTSLSKRRVSTVVHATLTKHFCIGDGASRQAIGTAIRILSRV
jgi:hypothetical protein